MFGAKKLDTNPPTAWAQTKLCTPKNLGLCVCVPLSCESSRQLQIWTPEATKWIGFAVGAGLVGLELVAVAGGYTPQLIRISDKVHIRPPAIVLQARGKCFLWALLLTCLHARIERANRVSFFFELTCLAKCYHFNKKTNDVTP